MPQFLRLPHLGLNCVVWVCRELPQQFAPPWGGARWAHVWCGAAPALHLTMPNRTSPATVGGHP
eukprot:2045151-Pyramimonas_sp.AAC.1